MPGFVKTVKDEEVWSKAKKLSTGKKGLRKGSRNFYAYANTIFHKIKGESNYPELIPQVGQYQPHGPSADHEDRYMTNFKTWWNNIDEKKKSETDKMLTPIPKNKFDTTLERPKNADGTPMFPKPDKVTVWGAPSSYKYIRA